MGTITDLSDLVNLQTNGSAQHLNFYVDNRIGSAAAVCIIGQYSSLWKYNKTNGANGGDPPVAPGENPTKATIGSMRYNNAASGKQLWLLGIEAIASGPGTFILYDRLYHCRGLSGTSAVAQSVGGSVTRNTGGLGNEIWLEIYTLIGTTATTLTASYTNQDGVTKTTLPIVWGGTNTREVDRVVRLPLANGDTGVQGVISVTAVATTGTAGDFGITIARPLTRGYIEAAACACFRDLLSGVPAMLSITDDACLALLWHAAAVTAPRIDFTFHAVEK